MLKKITLISILLYVAFIFPAFAQEGLEKSNKITLFYSPSCHECMKIKHEFLPEVERIFQGKVEIEYRDIGDMENYKLFLSLKEQYKHPAAEVPVIIFQHNFLSGQAQIKKELIGILKNSLGKPPLVREGVAQLDLISHFRSFTPYVIIGAGLIDGINPCAFTVIVFFISFLALQGYRKKDLIVIGISFIFAVFLTYLLIGLGLFGFFYRLAGFWLMAKIVNFSIGLFSLTLGGLAIYDAFKFKKTGKSEGLILQLPQAIKNQINRVIGLHYRRDKKADEAVSGNHMARLVFSAFITGFLVSILEAVCTGQTYLPTITFILKTTSLKLRALAYLLLYNLMFIIPLLAIFILALLGVTSGQFSHLLKKRLLLVKVLMAALFLSLGVFLIWRA